MSDARRPPTPRRSARSAASMIRSLARAAAIGASAIGLGCGTAGIPAPGLAANDPAARAFLDAHNRARSEIRPAPTPALAPLRWSPALAARAAEVVATCRFEHGRGSEGENLAGSLVDRGPEAVVATWLRERALWNPKTQRCARPDACLHYTQVVWRETRELGCATRRCERGRPSGGGPWSFSACLYAPAGNVEGERPY